MLGGVPAAGTIGALAALALGAVAAPLAALAAGAPVETAGAVVAAPVTVVLAGFAAVAADAGVLVAELPPQAARSAETAVALTPSAALRFMMARRLSTVWSDIVAVLFCPSRS